MDKTNYQLSKKELRVNKPTRKEFPLLSKHPIVCILDNLSNAHNVGVIIRPCEAFRLKKIYIVGSTPTLMSRKTKLSSRGTEKWIEIEYYSSILDLLCELKIQKYSIIGIELTTNSQKYNQAIYKFPVAFILGNEKNGISNDVLAVCDSSVHIEMFGMGNSLNVSTAASIVIADAVEKIV